MFRNGWYIVIGIAVLFVLDKIGGALWFANGPVRWSGLIGEAIGRGLGLFAFGYLFGGGVTYLLDRFAFRRARFANADTRPRFRNGWYCIAGISLWFALDAVGAARIQSSTTSVPIAWTTIIAYIVWIQLCYGALGTLIGGAIYALDRFVFRRPCGPQRVSRAAAATFGAASLAMIILVGAGLSTLPTRIHEAQSTRRYATGPTTSQQKSLDAARLMLLNDASDSDQSETVASVILSMFSDGEPWSEIDAIAKSAPSLYESYERFRSAALAAGYDPIWTEEEHLLYDRLGEVHKEYVLLSAKLGRDPLISEFGKLPANPYTGSALIVPSGHPNRADAGWTYEPPRLPFAVVPSGVRCRVPETNIERTLLLDHK